MLSLSCLPVWVGVDYDRESGLASWAPFLCRVGTFRGVGGDGGAVRVTASVPATRGAGGDGGAVRVTASVPATTSVPAGAWGIDAGGDERAGGVAG